VSRGSLTRVSLVNAGSAQDAHLRRADVRELVLELDAAGDDKRPCDHGSKGDRTRAHGANTRIASSYHTRSRAEKSFRPCCGMCPRVPPGRSLSFYVRLMSATAS